MGQTDAANHQYDVHDFYDAINSGNFPAVNFLKAPGYQDAHAGYSDPLDEQTFIVNVINFLQNSGYWNNTAVVIAYDDSDGWYDHQMPPIVNQSNSPADVPGFCGTGANALPGVGGVAHAQGRCGYGPRMPLLVFRPGRRPISSITRSPIRRLSSGLWKTTGWRDSASARVRSTRSPTPSRT